MQPDMIDDFMLCFVSDDNLYQGKILVNVIQGWKVNNEKNCFLVWCFSRCYKIWLKIVTRAASFYYVRGRLAAITYGLFGQLY